MPTHPDAHSGDQPCPFCAFAEPDALGDAIDLATAAVALSGARTIAHIDAATDALPDPCPICHALPCDAVANAYLDILTEYPDPA